MKNKLLQYIVLTFILIAFNNSYTWAEAFKSGPSDNEMKVLYFLLLTMIILIATTFVLLFATIAKKNHAKNPETSQRYYLFITLGILLGAILILPGAAFPLTIITAVFSLLGMLVYKSNPTEMNIGGWFFKSLVITIISGVISFMIMIMALF